MKMKSGGWGGVGMVVEDDDHVRDEGSGLFLGMKSTPPAIETKRVHVKASRICDGM